MHNLKYLDYICKIKCWIIAFCYGLDLPSLGHTCHCTEKLLNSESQNCILGTFRSLFSSFFPSQANQSTGRWRRVLQITVSGGLDSWGGLHVCHLLGSFYWASCQSGLNLPTMSTGKTDAADRHSKEHPQWWLCSSRNTAVTCTDNRIWSGKYDGN